MPFTSMVIRADGSLSACCENGQSALGENGEKLHLYKDSLSEAFSSKFFQELRAEMLAGRRHPSCQPCWRTDDLQQESKRAHENKNFRKWVKRVFKGKPPQQALDLSMNLGNLCNLKCRICGPTSSSRWAQEYLDLFQEDHVPKENSFIAALPPEEARSLITNWPIRDPKFTKDMFQWLPKVERLEFLGGEPFLNQKQFEIVRESARSKSAKCQLLTFVTNGSIFPDEAERKNWNAFKHVKVGISADGTEKQFEYQRYGAKWDEVTANFERFRAVKEVDNVNIMLSVSIFNIFYLPEIYSYWLSKKVVNSFVGKTLGFSNSFGFKRLYSYWLRMNDVGEFGEKLPEFSGSFSIMRIYYFFYVRIRFIIDKCSIRNRSRIFTSFVFNPHRFDIRVLPKPLKESIAKKFTNSLGGFPKNTRDQLTLVIDQMQQEDLSHLWPKTLESIWFHDKHRAQSFAATFPEFHAEAVRVGVWYDYETQKEYFFPNGIPQSAAAEA
jgi:hypothetical protein